MELHSGCSLYSDNGAFVLTIQPDGNLVLRPTPGPFPEPLWQSGTAGAGACRLRADRDNNFVIYTKAHGSQQRAVWSSGTANQGKLPARFVVGDDGVLSIHSGEELLWRHTGHQPKDEDHALKEKTPAWPAYLHPYGTGIPSPMAVDIRSAL
jgi:hypothetical protein